MLSRADRMRAHRSVHRLFRGIASIRSPVPFSLYRSMNSNPETPPLAPRIHHFPDIDHFRSWARNLEVDCTPLVPRISAQQTVLNLPGCGINYMKSFPRILDARLAPNCTAVMFTM